MYTKYISAVAELGRVEPSGMYTNISTSTKLPAFNVNVASKFVCVKSNTLMEPVGSRLLDGHPLKLLVAPPWYMYSFAFEPEGRPPVPIVIGVFTFRVTLYALLSVFFIIVIFS